MVKQATPSTGRVRSVPVELHAEAIRNVLPEGIHMLARLGPNLYRPAARMLRSHSTTAVSSSTQPMTPKSMMRKELS